MKDYRNIVDKRFSNVSARGSSGLCRPCSSKRGGSSIVASDVSDPGDPSRWRLLRSLLESLVLCEGSSSLCRLCRRCSRRSRSLSSLSGEGSREGFRAGSSCGSRLNLTLFSSSGAGLGLRDRSMAPIHVLATLLSITAWQ